MQVVLSHYQARTVGARVPELHGLAMSVHREVYARKSHRYDLPGIAWRQILDHLIESCYGPVGGKLDTMPQSVYSGLARIQKAVMRLEHHPALTPGRGTMGWIGEVIPAWPQGDAYTPYANDSTMVLLIPRFIIAAGREITIWDPGSLPEGHPISATFDEDFHRMFTPAPSSP